MDCFSAYIEWINAEGGGRKTIPQQGMRYSPLIRLKKNGKMEEWSIDFICPDFSQSNIISFHFLADGAPDYLIQIGNRYEIFEGSKKVAEIKILKSRTTATK